MRISQKAYVRIWCPLDMLIWPLIPNFFVFWPSLGSLEIFPSIEPMRVFRCCRWPYWRQVPKTADFLRARGISHNVASVELVTHVLHLWNRSQIFFQQLWNWSHFLGPIPQLPRQLWNWSQPKMHLWNRAQNKKMGKKMKFWLWPIPILLFWTVIYSNLPNLELGPIPTLTCWTVTNSNDDKLNCDLFQGWRIELWPIPILTN